MGHFTFDQQEHTYEVLHREMDLTPIDLYLLSDSSNCQIVVKTDVLRDVGKEASQNVMDLYTVHQEDPSRNLFQLAGTGSTTKGLKDSRFRGDYRCWVSVRLCDEFHMFGVKLLISKIVALCQSKLKVVHGLNGHYSIQAALYVSLMDLMHISSAKFLFFYELYYLVYSTATVHTM